jgi:hypothetical protein
MRGLKSPVITINVPQLGPEAAVLIGEFHVLNYLVLGMHGGQGRPLFVADSVTDW